MTMRAAVRMTAALVIGAALAGVGAAPAGAASACFGDPSGDTIDNATDLASMEPRADIVEVCVDYSISALHLSMQVVTPTDPATTPEWQESGSAVLFFFDNGFCAQLFRNGAGPFATYVFAECGGPGGPLVTQVPATFDGTRYEATVDPEDIGAPATLRLDARMVFGGDVDDQANTGFTDYLPNDSQFTDPVDNLPEGGAENATRLFGAERIATAIAISENLWTAGSAEVVALARADVFADALAGAQLAAALGPLLLTPGDVVPDAVLAEMARVLGGSGDVRILGGTAAVSAAAAQQVAAGGHTVTRLAGVTRYETSVAIADAANLDPSRIFVASGDDFPDALIAGATAPSRGGTMVLTAGIRMPAEVRAYLDAHSDADLLAVGSDAAAATPTAERILGDDVYETSALLAERFGDDPVSVAIASGENFPDGLSGGAHAATLNLPLLLSPQDQMAGSVLDYLESHAPFDQAILYGGPVVLSDTVAAQAAQFVGPVG